MGGGLLRQKQKKLTLTGNRSVVELNCTKLDIALRCTGYKVEIKSTLFYGLFVLVFSKVLLSDG